MGANEVTLALRHEFRSLASLAVVVAHMWHIVQRDTLA